MRQASGQALMLEPVPERFDGVRAVAPVSEEQQLAGGRVAQLVGQFG